MVVAADVFDFLADQRGDRTVIRAGGSGVRVAGADDRPPAVIGVGPVCLPGGAGRSAGAGQPGYRAAC